MMLEIRELTDDNETEVVGTVDAETGEASDEEIYSIWPREVWLERPPESIMAALDGPRLFAVQADDVEQEATPDGVPDDAEYVPPDESPGDDATVHKGPDGATYVTRGDDTGGDEQGSRFGMASDPETLRNAYEEAESVEGAREAGISGGLTTADEMEILEMPDGSRAFAIPFDAYDGTSGLMPGRDTAVRNNRVGPVVIEELGGNAARTEVGVHDGSNHIIKEGIEGVTLEEVAFDGEFVSGIQEELVDTMAAGYFADNGDMHPGNLVVSDPDGDPEVYVIDHDSGVDDDYGGTDPAHKNDVVDEGMLSDRINEIAEDIFSGGDSPVPADRLRDIAESGEIDRVFEDFESPPGDIPLGETVAEVDDLEERTDGWGADHERPVEATADLLNEIIGDADHLRVVDDDGTVKTVTDPQAAEPSVVRTRIEDGDADDDVRVRPKNVAEIRATDTEGPDVLDEGDEVTWVDYGDGEIRTSAGDDLPDDVAPGDVLEVE